MRARQRTGLEGKEDTRHSAANICLRVCSSRLSIAFDETSRRWTKKNPHSTDGIFGSAEFSDLKDARDEPESVELVLSSAETSWSM